MKKSNYILLISVLFFSCIKKNSWDNFQLTQSPHLGKELKLDGYYYRNMETGGLGFSFCFYKNGVCLFLGSGDYANLDKLDNYITTSFFNNIYLSNEKSLWGLFTINNNIIKIENYYPGDGKRNAYIREGVILNDSTFNITVSYRSNGTERRTKNEMYHFRHYAPKPDSTNNFFK